MRSDLEDDSNSEPAGVGPNVWRRATALVDAARSTHVPLSPEALTRVRRNVDRRLGTRGNQGRGAILPVRRLAAVVAALVLLSTVGAAAALWRYRHVAPPAPAAPGASAARPQAVSRGPGGVAPAAVAVAEAAPEAPVPPPDREGGHRSRRHVGAPVATETEARLLALALGQIRQQHDPQAALATLDRLERRFPGGVLADEARATRIEAAVAAKDLQTATRLVEGAALPAGRSGMAILVMRGELRAQAGRCVEAVVDFTRVLTQGALAAGELTARALYGRAVCYQQSGQGARARVDLEALRRDHLRSRWGREAQRLLDRDRPTGAGP